MRPSPDASTANPLSSLIKRYRRERSFTQRRLAVAAGVSARTIGDLETGSAAAPRFSTLAALADALGLEGLERAQLLRHADGADASPAAPFPVNPVPVVGREEIVEHLCRALVSGRSRVHTLTGFGGIGKTTVAIETALRLRASFGGNVAFVSLEHLTSHDAVIATMLSALGTAPVLPILSRTDLAARLIVVDNFEHVVAAAPEFAKFTHAFPSARFLVTSRCPLGIRGETAHELPPLRQADAERLFRDIVERSGLHGALGGSRNDEHVSGVCSALDGVPLAIELTVPLLRGTGLRDLAAQVHRRVPLQQAGPRDLSPRHRSMSASLDWSYDALDGEARTVAFALALFAGPAKVEWLAACAGLDLETTRAAVCRLAASSVTSATYDEDGEPRVRGFKMVRDYLSDRARDAGALHALRERHARWLVAHCEEAATAERARRIRLLHERRSEALDAVSWAHGHRETELGLRIFLAALALPKVHAFLDRESIRACTRKVLAMLDRHVAATPAAAALAASVRNLAGHMLLISSDYRDAEISLRAALAHFSAAGEKLLEGEAITNLAFLALNEGRDGEALDLILRLLQIAGSGEHDPSFIFHCYASSATAYFLLGNFALAEHNWLESERWAARAGGTFSNSIRAFRAYTLAMGGRLEALPELLHGLVRATEGGDNDDVAFRALAAEGEFALRRGDHLTALRWFARAFDRCAHSSTLTVRESSIPAVLHVASAAHALGLAEPERLALCAAATLRAHLNAPLFPVYRRHFQALLANRDDALEGDATRAVLDLERALAELLR